MIDDPQDETPKDDEAPEEAAAVGGGAADQAAADGGEAEVPGADGVAADGPEAGGSAGDEPTAEEPAEDATGDEPAEEPAEDATGDEPAEDPVAAEAPQADAPRPRSRRERTQGDDDEPEVIPGAHLEPDLVLDEPADDRGALGELAGAEIDAAEQALEDEGPAAEGDADGQPAPAPAPMTVLDLAADARYRATGKRKRAVARVILKPGSGSYTVNGRELDAFFPRPTLQTIARQPLQAVGQAERMDVVAKIHGGGVSAQAGALRHGIARALVEADPNLRGELKGRGFLTRDARVKERKKAGLKKARKRPQFSKR